MYDKITFGGKVYNKKFTVKVPCPVGSESTSRMGSTPSKGMGGDRISKKILDGVNSRMAGDNDKNDAATWAMELQLVTEKIDESPQYKSSGNRAARCNMNESIADVVGIDLRDFDTPSKKKGESLFKTKICDIKGDTKIPGDVLSPQVFPGLNAAEVKRRTNFVDESQFLLFICVVCNCDIDIVTSVSSPMTWYEEWLFVFEFLRG